jgi:tetratricopeptide (TPR) repeat protein
MNFKKHFSFILIFCCVLSFKAYSQEVILNEVKEVIPTYLIDPPNVMPRFYEGRTHQGVQRRIYPYPYDDGLTTNKQPVEYPMIQVENDFIKLGIAPGQGGRIYYAYDKTNDYNWLYHNHVVKPSLIGMVGNWRSGSLAWGYPHHHGPTTVEDMDYEIEEHPDGSKTIWINCTERLQRVNSLIGYTVYPNSSIVEMTIDLRNRTEMGNSFLFWANPAVHSDSAYQVIFPPSVQYVTYHGKRDMTSWPIADSPFNGYNFTGMDISWWKNTHVPVSFFSWDPKEDYFGGYDYNLKAGTAWVGNHHVSPGMKYWADGNNPNGLNTNNGLTDNDGRYIELMAGFYTDNQPDYSWLEPYESKYGSMIWFPIRELDGLKYANKNGAMNYFIDGNSIDIRLNSTMSHPKAKFVLSSKGKELKTDIISISPEEPRKIIAQLPKNIGENDIEITLFDSDGNVLYTYIPRNHDYPSYEKPEPLKSFASPQNIESVEELYLTGLRIDQFHSVLNSMPYYQEALKRDPKNSKVNTQLGILSLRAKDWVSAEKYLRIATERVRMNYTRPKDCEPLYYLGMALRALGRTNEAYDTFYDATWGSAWHSAAYYQLAEIDCNRQNWETALDHINRSLSTNAVNIRALNLKGVILRKMGKVSQAQEWLETVLKETKINHLAQNELYLMNNSEDYLNRLCRWMRDDVQAYIELSTEYTAIGLYDEAIQVMKRLEVKGETFPLLYYFTGYNYHLLGDDATALSYYLKAEKMPSDYCFPFRSEAVYVLENAMNLNPEGNLAPYYLGNLFYERLPEKAIELWEKSASLDDSFYIVQRNLGLAYNEIQENPKKALESMKKAAKLNKDDARLLFEIDVLHEANQISPAEKYTFLMDNYETAKKRYETLLRLITRAVEYGKFAEALYMLDNNRIVESEGAREKQNAYLNSYTIRAMNQINQKNYDSALIDIKAALDYPIGLVARARYAQLYYLEGEIYENIGQKGQAVKSYEKALEIETSEARDREYIYYKGLALQKLGKEKEAKQTFESLLQNVSDDGAYSQFDGRASNTAQRINAVYQTGLGYMGLGEKAKAIEQFSSVLNINPGHIWSKTFLNELEKN